MLRIREGGSAAGLQWNGSWPCWAWCVPAAVSSDEPPSRIPPRNGARDLALRHFRPLTPDRLWVADITHIMVPNRYLHLNIGVFKTERISGRSRADPVPRE